MSVTANAVAALVLICPVLAAGSAVAAEESRGRISELKTIVIEASSKKDPAPGSAANLYPPGARQFDVEGNVLLRCVATPEDRFSDCEVVEEAPKGKGFAASALAASGLVRQHIPEIRKGERAVALLPFAFVLEERKREEFDESKVEWEKRPSKDELTRAYPTAAVGEGLEGWAILGCEVTADGKLDNCRTYDEWPHGYHFSDAALKVTGLFKMRAPMKDGRSPAGGRIRIPVFFKMPQ